MIKNSTLTALPTRSDLASSAIAVLRIEVDSLDREFPKRRRREILNFIEARQPVVLDFQQVYFLDATGLDMVWNWIDTARQRGTKLCFVNCSKSVLLLFQLVRIPSAVLICKSTTEAYAVLNEQPDLLTRVAS